MNSCDGSGSGVQTPYVGGDGKAVVLCEICGRKFVVKTRRSKDPWPDDEEHHYGILPTHKWIAPKGAR